jgi:hypothetical protein
MQIIQQPEGPLSLPSKLDKKPWDILEVALENGVSVMSPWKAELILFSVVIGSGHTDVTNIIDKSSRHVLRGPILGCSASTSKERGLSPGLAALAFFFILFHSS